MTDTATGRWERYSDAGRRSLGQGKLAEAEEAFRAALSEAEQLGPASPQLAASLNALGQLRLQAKDLAAAEAHLTRALAIREKVYGPAHQALVPSLNNLGALYDAKGSLDEAAAVLQRALTVSEQQLGAEHPDVALALNNLAKIHIKRREYGKADRLLIRLLAIRRALGKDHPEVATVLGMLARLRLVVGKPQLGEQLWRQALAIRERTFAPNDPLVASTLESLADCCAAQPGRLAEAVALRERALGIRVGAQGEGHPVVANARAKLGELQARAAARAAEAAPEEPLPPPPPPRPSGEAPASIVSQEGPRFDPSKYPARPTSDLPWIPMDGEALPAPPASRDEPVSFRLATAPAPRNVAPGRPASARPTPLRSTGQRAPMRAAPKKKRRILRALVGVVVVLAALGGGGWYVTQRGLVAIPPAVERVLARVLPAPATAATPPVTPALVGAPDSAPRPAVLASSAPAPTRSAVATPASRAPVDATPDDGLHPKVKVDLKSHTIRGAVEIDAITRAIDRATKAKLDSVDRARLGVKGAPRRP